MPTRPEDGAPAILAAVREVEAWERIVALVEEAFPEGGPPESSVVRFHDPGRDLAARGARWGFTPATGSLAEVVRFAGGLALAESEARRDGESDVALAAFVERRRLVGDRLVHWAVPWLLAASSGEGDGAGVAARLLLEVADALRPAPAVGGTEGLFPPGEDSYGPVEFEAPIDELLVSVWSGLAAAEPGQLPDRDADDYEAAAPAWRHLAAAYEGTARLWLDLAGRAERTARLLRAMIGANPAGPRLEHSASGQGDGARERASP